MSLELRVRHLEELVVALQQQVADLQARLGSRTRESSFDFVCPRLVTLPLLLRLRFAAVLLLLTQPPPAIPCRASAPEPLRFPLCRKGADAHNRLRRNAPLRAER